MQNYSFQSRNVACGAPTFSTLLKAVVYFTMLPVVQTGAPMVKMIGKPQGM